MNFGRCMAGGLVKLYQVVRQDRELQAWIKLLLSTFYSGLVTFMTATGTAGLAHDSPFISVCYGLLASSGAIVAVLMRAPQTRGMFFRVSVAATKASTDPDSMTITGPGGAN